MRKLILIPATIVLAVAMAAPALAGGGGLGTARCPGFAAGGDVEMLDNCFAGTAHFAPAGGAITVVNDGQLPHTYTAVDGSFDSGVLQPGESVEIVLKGGGVHEVFCTLHGTAGGDGMAGVLVVGERAAAVAMPAAAVPAPPLDPLTPELVAALDRQSAAMEELIARVPAVGRSQGWPAPLTVVLVVAGLALAGIVLVTRGPIRASI